MKTKILFLITFIGLSISAMAGGDKFESAMENALKELSKAQSPTELKNVANRFDRIANTEKEEWLPRYYHARIYINLSFMENDPEQRDLYLDEAEKDFAILVEQNPNEAEIHALHALFYTARLAIDPATRGMEFSMLSAQAAGKARAMAPNNPRAAYVHLVQAHGKAGFFGQDPTPYCTEAGEIAATFDDYKVPSAIHPTWGKEELEQLSQSCK